MVPAAQAVRGPTPCRYRWPADAVRCRAGTARNPGRPARSRRATPRPDLARAPGFVGLALNRQVRPLRRLLCRVGVNQPVQPTMGAPVDSTRLTRQRESGPGRLELTSIGNSGIVPTSDAGPKGQRDAANAEKAFQSTLATEGRPETAAP